MRFNRSLVAPTSMGPKALLLASVCALLMLGGEAQAQAVTPAAPTGLTASSVSHDSVTLTWDDPGDSSITGYRVLRRSRDGDEYGDGEGAAEFIAVVDDTGSSANTYTDYSVTPRTRYVYRVKAINSVGTSGQSSYLNVETADGPTPPAAPIGLAATSIARDSVTLIWDDPGDSSITGYQVLRRSRDGDEYRDGQGTAEFAIIVEDTGSLATTYTDTSVTARTRYVYRVKAINSVGTSGQSGYLNVETPEAPIPGVVETPTPTVPEAPTGLAVSTTTHDSVTLTWDDPGDSSITGYQVLRRSRDDDEYGDGLGAAEFTAIADDTGTSALTYTDTSVTARTRYVYRVKARNPQGLGESSNDADAETPEAPAPTVPAAPTGLAVSTTTHDSVALSWDDSGDSTKTGYQVLRRSRDGDEYGDGLGAAEFAVIVDDTGTSTPTYTDASVTARTRYFYHVKAMNPYGVSDSSSDADAETAEAPVSQRIQPCQEGYVQPTPTEIDVPAVPIVVESTAADYFVLYASHDVDGETMEYPVRVVLGEDGVTTLSENVATLPVERYRVEKYSAANPADIDGDCTDDITELNDLGTMNPVNPADSIEPSLGALAVPDRETFEALSYADPRGTHFLKFVLVDQGRARRPGIYFLNTNRYSHHFDFLTFVRLDRRSALRGAIIYDPDLVAPDGSSGAFRFVLPRGSYSVSFLDRTYTMLAASMPLLDDNLALWIQNQMLKSVQAELPLYRASRMHLVFDDDVYAETPFQSLNPGEGYGVLRSLEPDERPHSRDVVIYETLPNDLPRVAGIISTVPQTPLSHVNLRALQDRVPNAFIRNALEDEDISNLIGSYVYYSVDENGYTIRAASQAEVDAHYTSLRPSETQTPERDLTVTYGHPTERHRLRRLGLLWRQGGQRGRAQDAAVPGGDRAGRVCCAVLLLR